MDQRAGGSLAYIVDGQGRVLAVREATPLDPTPAHRERTPRHASHCGPSWLR